jgi:transcriptional regulator with XRE-family HTH domain
MKSRTVDPTSLQETAVRMKRTREAHGLNQTLWCRLTGLKLAAWNNYEKALRRINIDDAIMICQATGVSLDWIYRGNPSALPTTLAKKLRMKA